MPGGKKARSTVVPSPSPQRGTDPFFQAEYTPRMANLSRRTSCIEQSLRQSWVFIPVVPVPTIAIFCEHLNFQGLTLVVG
jgi:hypothetical protein